MQVVLSGFSGKLLCFFLDKNSCRYGCMYFLAALVLVGVDMMVNSYAYDRPEPVLWVELSLQCNCKIMWVRGRHLEERQF